MSNNIVRKLHLHPSKSARCDKRDKLCGSEEQNLTSRVCEATAALSDEGAPRLEHNTSDQRRLTRIYPYQKRHACRPQQRF